MQVNRTDPSKSDPSMSNEVQLELNDTILKPEVIEIKLEAKEPTKKSSGPNVRKSKKDLSNSKYGTKEYRCKVS